MRLDEERVAEIKAAEGCYRAADVARHYEVHRSTVVRIWAGEIHKGINPSFEAPNITTRPRTHDVRDDIVLLLRRGMPVGLIAQMYGISKRTVYAVKEVST